MSGFRASTMGSPDQTPLTALPIITGPATPESSEVWPLTLFRVDGGLCLGLVAPHGTQAIAGIHEALLPTLEKVTTGTELPYLCRTAPGTDYNVRTLHAVAFATRDGRMQRIAQVLPDDLVRSTPRLLLARARQRLEANDVPHGLEDLTQAMAQNAEQVDAVWSTVPVEHRASLLPGLAAWAERQSLPRARLLALPFEAWPTAELSKGLDETWNTERPRGADPLAFGDLLAEATRRGDELGAQWQAKVAHRARLDEASTPRNLRPELLPQVLARRDSASLGIYADALSEAGHPYGEFLTLSLKATKASLKAAKALAGHSSRAWLGPLTDVLDDVEYELGLPVGAHLVSSKPIDLTSPLLPCFRRLLVSRRGAQRWPRIDVKRYLEMVRVMQLTELDAGPGVIDHLPTLDGAKVTHLHGLDVLAGVDLEARAWPVVQWVEVPIAAGTSLRVLDALLRDVGGLFAARRPALALRMSGKASTAELANVRAALPKLRSREVTVNGKVF